MASIFKSIGIVNKLFLMHLAIAFTVPNNTGNNNHPQSSDDWISIIENW